MERDELRRYQLSQLELMDALDELCAKLNLKYYLIGGTLLGAIRHKGFIPWDADMDVAMPREDYEKLRQYFEENPHPRFFFQHHSTEKNHLSPHAILKIKGTNVSFSPACGVTRYTPKHTGIYLDIFPLDTPPCDPKKQQKQAKKLQKIKRTFVLKAAYHYGQSNRSVKGLAKNVVRLLLSPQSFSALGRRLDRTMRAYEQEDSGYLVSMASHYSYKKQLMKNEIYGTPTRVEFEGKSYCAPEQWDKYLTQLYRDYMKLPSQEEIDAMSNTVVAVDYGAERPSDV